MNPLLFQRRARIDYASPPVCEVELSSSGFPTIILPPLLKKSGFVGDNLFWNSETELPRLEWPQYPGALCYTVYIADDPENPFGTYHIVAECVPPLEGDQPPMGGGPGSPLGGFLTSDDTGDYGYGYVEIITPEGELIWTGPPFGFGEPPNVEELVCTPLTECAQPVDNVFCDDYWSFASTVDEFYGTAEFNKFGDRFCAKAVAVNSPSNTVASRAYNRVSTFSGNEPSTIGPVRLDVVVTRGGFNNKYDARVRLLCLDDFDEIVFERNYYDAGTYSESVSFPVGAFSSIYFRVVVEAGSDSSTGPVNGWIGAVGNFSMEPAPMFYSAEASATASYYIDGVTDPDFLFCNALSGSFSYTVPAGTFGGSTQEEADYMAQTAACSAAQDWLGSAAASHAGCTFNGGTFHPTSSC